MYFPDHPGIYKLPFLPIQYKNLLLNSCKSKCVFALIHYHYDIMEVQIFSVQSWFLRLLWFYNGKLGRHAHALTLDLWWLFQVRYKEKYEKEKGKAMLDFETPTYVTAKEAQHMQSQVNTLSVSSGFKKATNAIHFSLSLSQSEDSLQPAIY